MALRVLASIILLFSVLFLPFWVSVILGLVSIAYFPFFIEAVFIFFLSDLLYAVPEAKFFGIVYVSFIFALAIFIGVELLRKRLRLQR